MAFTARRLAEMSRSSAASFSRFCRSLDIRTAVVTRSPVYFFGLPMHTSLDFAISGSWYFRAQKFTETRGHRET